jgi:hypothetical protein
VDFTAVVLGDSRYATQTNRNSKIWVGGTGSTVIFIEIHSSLSSPLVGVERPEGEIKKEVL